ncbi:MAG: hypothetical protein EP322_05665 [Bacteroidetes bacterium]|nr:MAG: hypothetical protein EP322_05665 [Bacteroidota bacterium]
MEQEKANISDSTVGVVAYITLIGFIIAIVLNGSKEGEEKKFGAFHLRQALGLIIFAVGIYVMMLLLTTILISISWALLAIVSFISMIVWLGLLALIIMGIINAANKTYKEVPVIGKFSSKILGNTFE